MNNISVEGKIKAIHGSNLFGVIVECGNGACIANSLYDFEGASKTIYYSKQPYSKEYQNIVYRDYGFNNVRSVSYEFLNKVHCGECDYLDDEAIYNSKLNFILSSSFQIQGKDDILTHGWIGFEEILHPDIDPLNVRKTFYHISVPTKYGSVFTQKRKNFFNIISNIAVDLLYSKVDSSFVFKSEYIDNIVNLDYKGDIINEDEDKLLLFKNLKSLTNSQDSLIYINQNSTVLRIEDFCRDKEGIILVKGSFNPLHKGHIELLESAKKLYPNYNPAFYISIGNRDKDNVNEIELLKRIQNINQHEYGVVLGRMPMFIDNVKWFRSRYMMPIVFPVGYDTINRFADDCVKEIDILKMRNELSQDSRSITQFIQQNDLDNVKFLVFPRKDYNLNKNTDLFSDIIRVETIYKDDGISSSKIRNGEIENKI